MNEKNRIFLLIVIMAISSLMVASLTISILYRAAYDEERARLVESSQIQARYMEAIARYDIAQSEGRMSTHKNPREATLSQILDVYSLYGFGLTGQNGFWYLMGKFSDEAGDCESYNG